MVPKYNYWLDIIIDFQTIIVFMIAIIPYWIQEYRKTWKERKILAAAFVSEIESIIERYKYAAGIFLETGGVKQNSQDELLLFTMEITQEYFTVYHNNTNRIGLFEVDEVRKIVDFYVSAKGLVDTLLSWNDLVAKIDKFDSHFANSGVNDTVYNKKLHLINYVIPEHRRIIIQQQSDALNKADEVTNALKKYNKLPKVLRLLP